MNEVNATLDTIIAEMREKAATWFESGRTVAHRDAANWADRLEALRAPVNAPGGDGNDEVLDALNSIAQHGWGLKGREKSDFKADVATVRAALTASTPAAAPAPVDGPAPNWCRTCGKHRNDPMAMFCNDVIHHGMKTAPTSAPTAEHPAAYTDPEFGYREREPSSAPTADRAADGEQGDIRDRVIAWTDGATAWLTRYGLALGPGTRALIDADELCQPAAAPGALAVAPSPAEGES